MSDSHPERTIPTAHAIAARLTALHQQHPSRTISDLLAAASTDIVGASTVYSDEELQRILSPRHFVAVRRTPGGPAPEETRRAVASSRAQLEADGAWWAGVTGALSRAEHQLAARSAAL